jgi:restriction system protein
MIPDYQTIMLPLLKFAGDKKEHHIREAIEVLAKNFALSEEERKKFLPSGQEPIFDNRVRWAKFYLLKANLITSTKRGCFRITERGLGILKNPPNKIDNSFLMKFPEFVEFRRGKKKEKEEKGCSLSFYERSTPDDLIAFGYQKLRDEISKELLNTIMKCSPSFFEKLVVDLLVEMGYGGSKEEAGKAIGRSGDEGIDGIIKEDKLGLDIIYIQAKRWVNPVGRPEIQKFVGALQGQKARKGIFITTSSFSKSAIDYVSKIESKVILIDGEELARLMFEHDVGVTTVATYDVKKIDLDYFEE